MSKEEWLSSLGRKFKGKVASMDARQRLIDDQNEQEAAKWRKIAELEKARIQRGKTDEPKVMKGVWQGVDEINRIALESKGKMTLIENFNVGITTGYGDDMSTSTYTGKCINLNVEDVVDIYLLFATESQTFMLFNGNDLTHVVNYGAKEYPVCEQLGQKSYQEEIEIVLGKVGDELERVFKE